MNALASHITSIHLPPYLRPAKSSKRTPILDAVVRETASNPSFAFAVNESESKLLHRIKEVCSDEKQLTPRAREFLGKQPARTLVLALATSSVTERTALASTLRPWFGVVVVDEQLVFECVDFVFALRERLKRDVPAERIQTCLAYVDERVAQESNARRVDAALLRTSTPAYAPRLVAVVACFRPHLRLPKHVCGEKRSTDFDADTWLLLVRRFPEHVPGFEFERVFASVVYDDPDRPCLHEALAFCASRDWASVWENAGFKRDQRTLMRLALLNERGFDFDEEDAIQLMCWAWRNEMMT